MNVLVACEESQTVCNAFRQLGHEAYSCDLVDCSGGHPEWHIVGNALNILNGFCTFKTSDSLLHKINAKWDIIIAHPPCTYLSYAATRVWNAPGRSILREAAFDLFMKFINADCDKICVENPVGYLVNAYRHADQIVHPYYFGDPFSKRTCLWLKNLPLLQPTSICDSYLVTDKAPWFQLGSGESRRKNRSKTFPGLAYVMASQFTFSYENINCDYQLSFFH